MKKHSNLGIYLSVLLFIACKQSTAPDPVLLPVVTTAEVRYVLQNIATSGGEITSDGGSFILYRGVCWSTKSNPTIADSKTVDGADTGSFTSHVTGLTGGTTYFIKAYATTSEGNTGYGNEYKITTDEKTPMVTDADGNTYHTIQIGTQLWMVENLKTTKYNDGTTIPTVKISIGNEFSKLLTPAYCWYKSDSVTFKNTFGALYNGYAVSTGKLAPIGWHVPSTDDWIKLSDYLGGDSIAGGKLKSTDTNVLDPHEWFISDGIWFKPNTGAINSSGFSGLPGGNIASYGFGNGGTNGTWWCSTASLIYPDRLCVRELNYTKSELIIHQDIFGLEVGAIKTFGFSIRCVRD